MPIFDPAFCGEKKRLIAEYEYMEAVSAYLNARSAPLKDIAIGAGYENEAGIKAAKKLKDEAKRAVVEHQTEHGC